MQALPVDRLWSGEYGAIPIGSVSEGSEVLRPLRPTNLVAGQYIVVYDDSSVPYVEGLEVRVRQRFNAEIAKVRRVSFGAIFLDRQLRRTFTNAPKIATPPIQAEVVIRTRDLDGKGAGSSLIGVSFADRVIIEDVRVSNYYTHAVRVDLASNVSINGCFFSGGFDKPVAGAGVAVLLQWCTKVSVEGVKGEVGRHLVQLGGCSSFKVSEVHGEGFIVDVVNTHGINSRSGLISYVSGRAIQIGNPSYLGEESDIVIRDAALSEAVHVGGKCRRIALESVRAPRLVLHSYSRDDKTLYPEVDARLCTFRIPAEAEDDPVSIVGDYWRAGYLNLMTSTVIQESRAPGRVCISGEDLEPGTLVRYNPDLLVTKSPTNPVRLSQVSLD